MKKQKKSTPHKWRLCPAGQYWRREHIQGTHTKADGTVVESHLVSAGCCHNPSGKDQLYPDEIQEIAKQSFSKVTKKPCPKKFEFKKMETPLMT